MREKKVENYYMNLNGFAYDPFMRGGLPYIRVAKLGSETSRVVFCIVNGSASLVSRSMPDNEFSQVLKDLPRNINVILGGLSNHA